MTPIWSGWEKDRRLGQVKEDNPKQKLLKLLAEHHEIAPIRGSDIVAVNSKAILYLRYNKNAGPTEKYLGKFWFGITKSEYDKYRRSNFFLVCACGVRPDKVDYIVLPSDDFENIKQNIPLRSGQWKFNLLKTQENKYLLQITKGGIYDVSQYLNFFDFSPRQLRKTFSPAVAEVSAPTMEKPDEKRIEEPSDLENELLTSARDSGNPKRFEVALERFFSEIGFKCHRVGGAGETDILIYEPIRIIVDGKSTKAESKSAINFTRIKRHRAQNNAELMMIVSVGFDPAVGRDAELEGACLIDIDALLELLTIDREFVLSPFDYLKIFQVHGIVDLKAIREFKLHWQRQHDTITKVINLINSMDFTPRPLDEIKGRLDLYCEQKNVVSPAKDEIVEYLTFLSSETFKIISYTEENYSLRYTPEKAKERFKTIARSLWKSTPQMA